MDAKVSGAQFRPADVCNALLLALEASEGRRKRRKRDQTPDTIGLAVKRELLQRAVLEDPDADVFEEWLVRYARDNDHPQSFGAVAAIARVVFEEWRMAHSLPDFRAWLDQGAPSEDAERTFSVSRSDDAKR